MSTNQPPRTLWNREPALILATIQAGIAMAIGFGLNLTIQQFTLIMMFMAAVIGLVTRTQVVPTGKLVEDVLLADGTKVVAKENKP